jgi:hypothetical protein
MKTISQAETMPGKVWGITFFQKTCQGLAPKSAAASIWE